MTIKCIHCNAELVKQTYAHVYGMRCMCHDEHRFLKIDDVLLGFHSDKVYLLENGYSQYDKTTKTESSVCNV